MPTEEPAEVPTEEPPPAGPSLGETSTRPADGMVMVYVPVGEFQMGAESEELSAALQLCNSVMSTCQQAGYGNDEQPVHTVELDGFWIDRTEVTNGQYQSCVNAGGCTPAQRSGGGEAADANHPVVNITWAQAQAYAAWVGGRLPTEAEWEYAARGPEGRWYPWGNEPDGKQLNYCGDDCWLPPGLSITTDTGGDGWEMTAPVGSYPSGVSWCGALDMSGNVAEWVADWYGDYTAERQVNPTGPSSGENHVIRGGDWASWRWDSRCASRSQGLLSLDFAEMYLGFRVVVPGSTPPGQ